MTTTNEILKERTDRYGDARGVAKVSIGMLRVAMAHPNWNRLSDSQMMVTHMIFNKLGRAINGDPKHLDDWMDIGGYSQLCADEICGSGDSIPEELSQEMRDYLGLPPPLGRIDPFPIPNYTPEEAESINVNYARNYGCWPDGRKITESRELLQAAIDYLDRKSNQPATAAERDLDNSTGGAVELLSDEEYKRRAGPMGRSSTDDGV